MTPHIEKLRYPEGATIVRQGETADRFYVICEGEVEVIRERPAERDLHIASLGENEYFGEIGLMTAGPRVATVRAVTPVTLLAFDPQAFKQLLDRSESDRQRFDSVVRKRIEQLLDAGLES